MIYHINNLDKKKTEKISVIANSPMDAVKRTYPNKKVSRNYDGLGNILVGRWVTLNPLFNIKTYKYFSYDVK